MTIRKHNVDTHHKHNTTDCNRLQQTATDCNTLQRNTVPAESCASATSTRVTSSWAASTSHKCVRYLPVATGAHREPGSPDIATSLLKNAVACCSVLQCVAVCCSVMQSVTSTRNYSTHRGIFRHRLLALGQHRRLLQCCAWQCDALCCSVLGEAHRDSESSDIASLRLNSTVACCTVVRGGVMQYVVLQRVAVLGG